MHHPGGYNDSEQKQAKGLQEQPAKQRDFRSPPWPFPTPGHRQKSPLACPPLGVGTIHSPPSHRQHLEGQPGARPGLESNPAHPPSILTIAISPACGFPLWKEVHAHPSTSDVTLPGKWGQELGLIKSSIVTKDKDERDLTSQSCKLGATPALEARLRLYTQWTLTRT